LVALALGGQCALFECARRVPDDQETAFFFASALAFAAAFALASAWAFVVAAIVAATA
jgi:hypothetical protein